MDKKIRLLNSFGITNNEAKVYITLLQMDASTGYKISKSSGIPR
ncbi:helix-turn-helix domain-containing protein [Companilactobacillus farciminis]